MKAAIFGAAGFLGQVLCRQLQAAGWEVLAYDAVAPGAAGDWSIFRPIRAVFKYDVGRKRGPVPLFPAVNGYVRGVRHSLTYDRLSPSVARLPQKIVQSRKRGQAPSPATLSRGASLFEATEPVPISDCRTCAVELGPASIRRGIIAGQNGLVPLRVPAFVGTADANGRAVLVRTHVLADPAADT